MPGSILKETIDPDTKAVILELSNAAKVIIKHSEPKKGMLKNSYFTRSS
ncbi:hypothetical protein AGMMS49990_10550 [Endomicrobiia bacterium]|nr:hypothetical protein AGMMS49990_10550 [Endomicrobiia bacterium]